MDYYITSDRECTIDGVGLVTPGKPVKVDVNMFRSFHGIEPKDANFPSHVTLTTDEEQKEEQTKVTLADIVKENKPILEEEEAGPRGE